MKKNAAKPVAVILGVVAAMTAVYVGASVWTGQRIKSQYESSLGQMKARFPALKVQHGYDRGLWSATSTLTLQLGCDTSPQAGGDSTSSPVRLTFVDQIQHGPWPGWRRFAAATIDTELQLPEATGSELARIFAGARPLVAHTVVAFDGSYDSSISSPAGTVESKSGQWLNWQGFEARVSGDMQGSAFAYELQMPGIELLDVRQGIQMKIGGLQWRGDGQLVGGSPWIASGKSDGQIAAIDFAVQPPVVGSGVQEAFKLGLAQLQVRSETHVEQDLLRSATSLTATGIAGSTRLDRIELNASLKRLHAPTYRKLIDRLMQGSSCDSAPRSDPQALLAALQQDLMQLLTHQPEYALDKLALEIGGRRGEISYAAGVQGVTQEDLKLPLRELLSTKGQLRADFKLPVAWIEQFSGYAYAQVANQAPPPELVTAMLEQFTTDGWLLRQGEHVASKLQYAGGTLQINGKEMQLGNPEVPAAAVADAPAAQ